ncbi:MAG: SpoIIE family protein phosphatase [Bacteroidetes bacterium]|nr:SpoIIE family protein phosphatase [Bacteroidota bacterium]
MLIIAFFSSTAFSQIKFTESVLLKKLAEAKTDSERVDHMIFFINHNYNLTNPKSIDYSLKAIELSKKINYKKGLLAAYEAAGDTYWYGYNYSKSVDYYFLELKLATLLNNQSKIANANYNIGWIKCVQQEMFSERKMLLKSLKVFEKLRDSVGIIQVCNAIATIYTNRSKIEPKYLDSANTYFRSMIFIGENCTKRNNMANIYANYTNFLTGTKKYNEAKFYSKKALKITFDEKDTVGEMSNKCALADLYFYTDSLQKAKRLLTEVTPYYEKLNFKEPLHGIYRLWSNIYAKEGNYKKALQYHLLYKDLTDTINSVIFRSNLQQKEASYEIDKREENIRRLQQANEVSALKNKQGKYIMAGMGIVALLIIGFAANLYRGNRNKLKANRQLSEQNRIIAEKSREIDQSIQYAKGIQNAVLPSLSEFKKILPQSFVIYLPKDVVSGDFYWMHQINEANSVKLLIAAADCTGHGVPGSLMSMVSVDKLNHAVFGKKLSSPSQILSSINNDIKNALKQDSAANTQKDGLDIALLLVDINSLTASYSGAHRPLWIIRKGELLEFKPTKTSIAGHTALNYTFKEEQISLQPQDLILIFSDGFADQFGGTSGKKMMTRNFKDHLLTIVHLPIPEIEESLISRFSQWKGAYEQIDDVLVIGFKI